MYMKSESLFALFNLKSRAISTVRILEKRNVFTYIYTHRDRREKVCIKVINLSRLKLKKRQQILVRVLEVNLKTKFNSAILWNHKFTFLGNFTAGTF